MLFGRLLTLIVFTLHTFANSNFNIVTSEHNHSMLSYNVKVDYGITTSTVPHFWESTGLCPPEPVDHPESFLLSKDMQLNLAIIGALPRQGLMQVRIHWLLNLITISHFRNGIPMYNFTHLDQLIKLLWMNHLKPGFEIMGNPSQYFNDFENGTQVYLWRDLVKSLAKHYIEKYGLQYIQQWKFESWNEPDHGDFNHLNFTVTGFLNYYDACSEGLQLAHPSLQLGGPAESLRKKFTNFSLALLQHCANGINYFTRQKGVRINFISLHEKGNYTAFSILEEEIQVINQIRSAFPELDDVPFFNDEGDPMVGWWKAEAWRADATYAGLMIKVIIQHLYFLSKSPFFNFKLLSNDNSFLNFNPSFFDQRTLLTRFQMNNSKEKEVQMIRKPIYAATGLLNYLDEIQAKLDINGTDHQDNWSSNPDFGAIATCHNHNTSDTHDSWHGTVLIYNVADLNINKSCKIKLNLSIENIPAALNHSIDGEHADVKYIVYKINNIVTNPYKVWIKMNKPVFPSYKQLSKMRSQEEPHQYTYPHSMQNSKYLSYEDIIPQPGILLFHICKRPLEGPKQVKNVKFIYVSKTDVLLSWFTPNITRCLLTYEIQYSRNAEKMEFKCINKHNVIFQSFHHSVAGVKQGRKKQLQGFYRIRAIDYWNQAGQWSKIKFYKEMENH